MWIANLDTCMFRFPILSINEACTSNDFSVGTKSIATGKKEPTDQ